MKKINLRLIKIATVLLIIILSLFINTESFSAYPPNSELTVDKLRRNC